jgi:hypothetical protein
MNGAETTSRDQIARSSARVHRRPSMIKETRAPHRRCIVREVEAVGRRSARTRLQLKISLVCVALVLRALVEITVVVTATERFDVGAWRLFGGNFDVYPTRWETTPPPRARSDR